MLQIDRHLIGEPERFLKGLRDKLLNRDWFQSGAEAKGADRTLVSLSRFALSSNESGKTSTIVAGTVDVGDEHRLPIDV